MTRHALRSSAFFLALWLSGCAAVGGTDQPVVDRRDEPALADLREGVDRYERGRYTEAIRVLQSSQRIWAASDRVRVEAFKYLAFSQCVSNRRKDCRQSFEALLTVDPKFELAVSEAGHPQWGPVFRAAKAKL